MSFIETVRRARAFLRREGRISQRALALEFALDDDQIDALVEELVDIQQVAAREGKALAWVGPAGTHAAAEATDAPAPEAARPAAAAERRQLTVLFCDLVDSTALASRLDPEDWREVVRGYQQAAAQVVERYDGYVAQYLGDGLLIYFGWPLAHEDDAERALRAGLGIVEAVADGNDALQAKHGIELAVRIGIHTGPVVVGEMGGGTSRETLAMGDTTIVAARLQGIAEPDTVVMSPATLRLVAGIFVTEDLGPQALKGVPQPVGVHRVIQPSGVRSRLDTGAGRLTRFVGRDQEVGLLADRWEQVLEGRGQTVLITGEAGIGKTRLVHTLRERLADDPHSWLECRCSFYTSNSPFHPLIELVKQGLTLREEESPDSKLRKLEAGLARVHFELEATVPLFTSLLSMPHPESYPPLDMTPELQRRKTFEALVAWPLALAELQPLVLVVEDLHWCDPSSLKLFGMMIEQCPTAQMLMVLSARPEFTPPWPSRSSCTSLTLNRLMLRPARQMAESVSPDLPLPEAALDLIVAKADGVPLYVEDLTKGVLESGVLVEREGRYELVGDVKQLAIPETLQGSLMARLDRVAAAKQVAQTAAVLGREFPYRLLAAVAEVDEATLHRGLTRLVEAELLFQRGTPPEAIYTFKHALIQDTAYESVLKALRRKLHSRTANAIENLFPEWVASEPEVVAQHCEAAGLLQQAVAYYQRAGERATERSAHVEAAHHLVRGIDLLQQLPEGMERTKQELRFQIILAAPVRAAKGAASPELDRTCDRARQLTREIDDWSELFDALSELTMPVIVVNPRGDLLYFNEPAEGILGRSFDETGEIHRGQWSALFQPTYEQGQPIKPKDQLLTIATDRRLPAHGSYWIRGLDGVRRLIEGLALPLEDSRGRLLGAMAVFWELQKAAAEEGEVRTN